MRPGSGPTHPASPALEDAERILSRYGGDPTSPHRTGRALARFFSSFRRRFTPLFGRSGYRTLIEQAHVQALRAHPLLERWPTVTREDFSVGSPGKVLRGERAVDLWEGAVALTGHFLTLLDSVARRGELDGLDELDPWGGPPAKEEDSPPSGGDGKGGRTRTRDPWRILVMDRDLTTCQAIARSLDVAPDFHVVSHARAADEVREKIGADCIDFVVASGHLPVEEVLDVCRWLRRERTKNVPLVVISGLPEDHGLILRFLEAGAGAVTLSEFSVEGLRLSIRLLARGEAILPLRLQHLMSRRLAELSELVRDRGLDPQALSRLSPREAEVLQLMERDLTNRQIASRLYIAEGTVKSHVHHILRKLKVRDRDEAVRLSRLEAFGGGQAGRDRRRPPGSS